MAPEQARDARQADIRSDIYSLGCTFYFMLVGKPPFPDGSALQKLLQHQSGEPPNLAQFRPDVPESVVDVLDTMLAKRPEDRFQNPAELLAALIAVTEQLGIVYPQISLPVGWSTRPAERPWFHRHAPWLVPAALLLLSVLALGIVWHRQQPPPAFPELRMERVRCDNAASDSSAANERPPVPDRIDNHEHLRQLARTHRRQVSARRPSRRPKCPAAFRTSSATKPPSGSATTA